MSRESERTTGDGSEARPPSKSERPIAPGEILGGRYRIESTLGYGGMGVVYRARDLKLDQEIALKRLRPDKISPERREVLRQEIILARKVTHENVCRVFDLVDIEGTEFVSMEYVPGRALKDIEEQEGVLPLGRGLSIAKDICRGLAAAHRIGVLHRDLKPENVMIDAEGKPHLMDFGIAIDTKLWRHQKSSTVPGTPQFLAPELLRGAPPDARTDVYAMGVVLYEMFTGRVPFDDNDTNILVKKILSEKALPVETLRPDLPKELTDILEHAIAKDPAARFQSAEELATAIERYEGSVLDRVLREVSVARARSVKLMVILEANKALMGTFDPTEILKIILKTATSETDAERGTIFLIDPDTRELVSQILEGGTVDQIRLPWGRGIAGTCAVTGEPIITTDAYRDPRFDSGPDSSSGFRTLSILAAPMKTPRKEVIGVIEILNKRKDRQFNKEDEEFLMEVASHAAVAVSAQRHYEAALVEERHRAVDRIVKSLHPVLAPSEWPVTPGFESEPLRWRSARTGLLGYAVHALPRSLSILVAEDDRPFEEGIAGFLSALSEARAFLSMEGPAQIAARLAGRVAFVLGARASESRVELASVGLSLPAVFRDGSPLKLSRDKLSDQIRHAEVAWERGDLLVLCSSGPSRFKGPARSREVAATELARFARGKALSGAFMDLVSSWKAEGVSPGDRDVLMIAARRV